MRARALGCQEAPGRTPAGAPGALGGLCSPWTSRAAAAPAGLPGPALALRGERQGTPGGAPGALTGLWAQLTWCPSVTRPPDGPGRPGGPAVAELPRRGSALLLPLLRLAEAAAGGAAQPCGAPSAPTSRRGPCWSQTSAASAALPARALASQEEQGRTPSGAASAPESPPRRSTSGTSGASAASRGPALASSWCFLRQAQAAHRP